MLSKYVWENIAQENYHYNVDQQPTNKFAQENNLLCCLDLCGPTLCKDFICIMLTHGEQATFLRKITYTMFFLSSWGNIA